MSLAKEIQRYEERSPRSRAQWEKARSYLPGGDTRTSVFWDPYPLFFRRGSGPNIYDEDEIRRVDFINNFTSLAHGHVDPDINTAITSTAARGVAFGGSNEMQISLARLLCERVPSIELVRFTNSGTEATLNCIRAARAFTGRDRIAKAEGGYHGTHDAVSVSTKMSPNLLGDASNPLSVASTAGIPKSVILETISLPFNDVQNTSRIIGDYGEELAAIIVEPMLGSAGMIPASREYLGMLSGIAQKYGIILIFDEVVTLRLGPGGGQGRYGIMPDLTSLGKVIGGGLPIGAFGGRADIMQMFDPTTGPRIAHAGTFSGNPLTMAAGIAAMEKLTPARMRDTEILRDYLVQGIQNIAAEFDVPVQVTGMGPFYGIHFTQEAVQNFRVAANTDRDFKRQVFLGLLNEDVLVAPQLVGALSTPTKRTHVDFHVEALRRVFARRES